MWNPFRRLASGPPKVIIPARAPVRPRVFCPQGSDPLLLEEEVAELLAAGRTGFVALIGDLGSGRTTALGHLAATISDTRLVLLDEPTPAELKKAAKTPQLIVYTAVEALKLEHIYSFRLATWTDDELIEYLLAVHREHCASVMRRLRPEDRMRLGGLPYVWRIVLDELARDETIADGCSALVHFLKSRLSGSDMLEHARNVCLNAQIQSDPDEKQQCIGKLSKHGFTPELLRLLQHPTVQVLLAAERVASDLHGATSCEFFAHRLPRELVQASAEAIGQDAQAREHLRSILAASHNWHPAFGSTWGHPMAASVLNVLEPKTVPPTKHLEGAYLNGAHWPGAELSGVDLTGSDLTGADLRQANLRSAKAAGACFVSAQLAEACLTNSNFANANFGHADMTGVRADQALLTAANLEEAILEGSLLTHARLENATLFKTVFAKADLSGAKLAGTNIEGADFTDANLTDARLTGLPLRLAIFAGATFRGANLVGCDLEEMKLPDANFEMARLDNALMTGSVLHGANFRCASFKGAKLADIDWEGACLYGADLREVTFHMGSTRSGTLSSPYASEGTRTGYYTDDYNDQYFKAPEEIRKVNLCGADLRNARIDDVDFYLVDLRGAQYDPIQADHFRRCGAILHDHQLDS